MYAQPVQASSRVTLNTGHVHVVALCVSQANVPTCHPVLFLHVGNKTAEAQSQMPAQHNPAAPDGDYCCHDAALQLSRLPTLAGGGIRFGLVRSDDQPRRRNVMGSRQAGGLAGGGRPGPWALGPADGQSPHTPSMRSMRYIAVQGCTYIGRGTVAVQTRASIPLGPKTTSLPKRGGEVEMDVRKTPCGEKERVAGS